MRDDLVGNPIDMPQRVDQSGPGRRKVAGMVGDLPINPVDDVATGNVADEQEQAVRSLIQPAVPEGMPGQRDKWESDRARRKSAIPCGIGSR